MRRLSWIICLFVGLLATSCQSSNTVLPTVDTAPTPFPTATISATAISQLPPETDITIAASAPPANVRLVHAAVDTPTINIYSDSSAIATNLDFGQLTEPTPLNVGEHALKIISTGAQADSPAIFETALNLENDTPLLAVVAKQDDQYQLLTFPESIQPLNPGESIITVINAVPNSANLTLKQGDAEITTPIAFGTTTTSNSLPSGSASFIIQVDGNAASTYDLNLEAAQHYTLILAGIAEDIRVISFSTQSPGRANVRAITASEALNAIDVYLDEQRLVENATFGRPTERQTVIAGDYTVTAYEAGADRATARPLVSQILNLPVGENTALLILGDGTDAIIIPYEENLSPTPPRQSRIAFLNTLADVPTVHLETSSGPLPDVPDMGYGDAPVRTYLGASTYTFYWNRVGGNNPNPTLETVQDIQFEEGISYLYLVTGRMDNQPIVLSENVGVDENLTSESITQEMQGTGATVATLRFINVINDQTTSVDFQLDGVTIASNIGYGQGSDLIPIDRLDAAIGVAETGSGTGLDAINEPLTQGGRYTVVAYGASRDTAQMMLISDENLIFDGRSPHLRLINVSINNDNLIGLGFSPQDPTPRPGTPAVPPNEDLRRSIPGGIQRLVEGLPGSEVSSTILMTAGIVDLEILDSVTNQLATTVTNVELTADGHYDVLVYQEPETTRIRALVVPYPTP